VLCLILNVYAHELAAEEELVAGFDEGGGGEAQEGTVGGADVSDGEFFWGGGDDGVSTGDEAVVEEIDISGFASEGIVADFEGEDGAADAAFEDLDEAEAVADVG